MRSFIVLFLLLGTYHIRAQSLPAQVMGTSGENFMMDNGSLEWTIGEIMIETYTRPIGFLTQGFQQPSKVTITDSEKDMENGIAIYPNPVREVLFVKIAETGNYTLELFNLQGQKVVNESIAVHPADSILEVDMRPLNAAMYLLRLTNIFSGKIRIQKIEKY